MKTISVVDEQSSGRYRLLCREQRLLTPTYCKCYEFNLSSLQGEYQIWSPPTRPIDVNPAVFSDRLYTRPRRITGRLLQ